MSITPLTRFCRAADIVLRSVEYFEQIDATQFTTYSLEIRLSEIRELWAKVQNTYTECKNYLTASETEQVETIDVVEDKYNNSFIAYH